MNTKALPEENGHFLFGNLIPYSKDRLGLLSKMQEKQGENEEREVNETEHLKKMKQHYLSENKIELQMVRDGISKAQKDLERVTDMLSKINASKTNCNSNIVEPFELPEPIRYVEGNEPFKTAQEILCMCNRNSKIYHKMEQYEQGISFYGENHQLSENPEFYIAVICQRGIQQVKLYEKDILQQYRDNIDQLVRYQTILDRLNLEVKFTGYDGKEVSIAEDLIRNSQVDKYKRLLSACENQQNAARQLVSTKEEEIEGYVDSQQKALISEFSEKLEEYSNESLDESDFPEGMEEEIYEKKIEEKLKFVKLESDDLEIIYYDLQEKYHQMQCVGEGKSEEAKAIQTQILSQNF